MKIEYFVSEEDFLTYGRTAMTSSAAYKNGRWVTKFFTITIGAAALLILAHVLKGITDTYRWTVLASVFFYFLWIFVTSNRREELRIDKYLRSLIEGKKSTGVVGKNILELRDNTLVLSVEGCESVYQMFRVTEIVECPEHVLIKLGQSTEIVPRKKIESGDLQEFVHALKSKGVASSTFIEEKRNRIQPGVYVFIAAAISLIPALLGYSTYSDVKLAQFAKCLGDGGFESSCHCVCVLGLHEIFLLCATPIFVLLLGMSLRMFYKNWKNVATAHPAAPNSTPTTTKPN